MNEEWKATIAVLTKWAPIFANEYKANLADSRASGKLIDSIQYKVVTEGQTVSIVFTLEDYWKYVEEGRPPGKFPPPQNMLNWVMEKNIMPTPYTLPDGKQRIPSQMQLAYLIGRKIATDGTEGKYQLQKTLDDLMTEFLSELQGTLTSDIRDLIFNY